MRIVMVGAGHTHALALARVSRAARRYGAEVTLMGGDSLVPYSGMLPGAVAGLYKKRSVMIDAVRLASECGVQHIRENAVELDLSLREVHTESGLRLSYDVLSLNVGGDCTGVIAEEGGDVMAVKPVVPFLDWLDGWKGSSGLTCAVVGAGIAGVEVALTVDARLRKKGRVGGVYVVGRNKELIPGIPPLARVIHKVMVKRGISQILGVSARAALPGLLALSDNSEHRADQIIVCTGVRTWPGLARSGIQVDDRGCVVVNSWLRSVSHPDVFACGDCASWSRHPIPKSGVFAVRQARTLAHNLAARMAGRPCKSWDTSRHALSIVCLGDGRAVAHRNGVVLRGRLVWRWKDYLDSKFMRRFG